MKHFSKLLLILAWVWASAFAAETRQATGVRVGEVSENSALVWMRLTAKASRKSDGVPPKETPLKNAEPDTLEGACPGAPGKVRLRYGVSEDLAGAKSTPWIEVSAATADFSHIFTLKDLQPATRYFFAAETSELDGTAHAPLRGQFATAPKTDAPADVSFTVITGQMYKDLDDREGFKIYESMLALKPDFIVPTGDEVYYDNDVNPLAHTPALARHHWNRMYSLPKLVKFHLNVPAFFEKDDHDILINDCWPGMNPGKMAPLTFKEGQQIFREQCPVSDPAYRTVRWGKHLQVWLSEGRDYRSPNTMPDGPEKTIWGAEQKAWFKKTVSESDATWKVLVSPTPMVGPDRGKDKNDNHANLAFSHEGDELRQWMQKSAGDNFFVACGDRHWQYHSVDPKTGVQEFSCGPVSNEHAAGSPGENKEFHKFHRVKGGFLSVNVKNTAGKSTLSMRFHDVNGAVVYEFNQTR
jgi:alkaline phosphatase D